MPKTRRLQILLEPDQFERIERAAADSGGSIASVIRDAIDRYVPDRRADRKSAMEAFLRGREVEMGDWAEEKRRMLDEMAGMA